MGVIPMASLLVAWVRGRDDRPHVKEKRLCASLSLLVELARGLWTTLRMMFDKPVTVQYPEQKKPVKAALPWAACPEALR